MSWIRYGPWRGGPDPLAPPFDATRALDAMSDRILAGSTPAEALAGLLRQGAPGLRGLGNLRRQVRQRLAYRFIVIDDGH